MLTMITFPMPPCFACKLSSRFALQKTAERRGLYTISHSTKIGFFRPPRPPPLSLVIMDKVLFYTDCNQFGVFSNLLSLFQLLWAGHIAVLSNGPSGGWYTLDRGHAFCHCGRSQWRRAQHNQRCSGRRGRPASCP